MDMTSSTSESLIFLLIASMVLASTMANMDWQNGFNYTDWGLKHGYYHPNQTQVTPNKIIVGGSKNWQFGVNYTDWARKNGPFYLNDVLVFKYDRPSNETRPHSVYLLPNLWSYMRCDLRWAKKVGDVNQGVGNGFELKLNRLQPYYFACGESNAIHCNVGLMKFFVIPMLRGWHY